MVQFFYSCDSADSRSIKIRSILHSQYLLKQRWKPRCLTDSRQVANGITGVLVELLERSQGSVHQSSLSKYPTTSDPGMIFVV